MCVCFGVCQSAAVCPCGGLCFLVVFLVGCGLGGSLVRICVSWGICRWFGVVFSLKIWFVLLLFWEDGQVGIGVSCAGFGNIVLAVFGCVSALLRCLVIFVMWVSVYCV